MLDETGAGHSEHIDRSRRTHGSRRLKIDDSTALTNKQLFDNKSTCRHQWSDGLKRQCSAVTRDLGGVIDEVRGHVGIERSYGHLLEIQKRGEVIQCVELLGLCCYGGSGIDWTAQGDVLGCEDCWRRSDGAENSREYQRSLRQTHD